MIYVVKMYEICIIDVILYDMIYVVLVWFIFKY